jgi:O-antigen/teichoic acid export membrane protein
MKNLITKFSFSNIKRRIERIKQSDSHEASIFKNMAKLTTGTGLAKIVGVLTAPIITRIYLPEDMGVLSVFTSVIAILVPFTTFKYALAIPLPKNDGIASNIFVFCSTILLIVTIVLFIILSIFSEPVLMFFNIPKLVPYWWLIPIGLIGTGLYEILTNWAIREKAFKQYAKTIIWQTIIGSSTKIGLGLIGLRPLGLLVGQIFKQAGGILSLSKIFFVKLKENLRFITSSRVSFLSKYYSGFPKYRLPAQFLMVLATKTPLLFFAWHFGIEETGQLGLTFSMLAIPINLFGATTAKAYYGEIAKLGIKNKTKIYQLTKRITKKLFYLGTLPFLILVLIGPWLFSNYFGQEWREAGVYASILAVYLLSQFVYSPIGNGIFNVFDKQSIVLLINVIRVVIVGVVFFSTYLFDLTPSKSLLLYSIAISAYYIFSIIIAFKIIKK